MILAPRSGLWTPARRRPPDALSLYEVSGASQLPRDLTINGTTVQASFVYDASDITGSPGSYSWPEHYAAAGGTLTEAGAGALAAAQAGPFTDGTEGVLADGTDYLATAAAFATFGTDDLVIEMVCKISGTNGSGRFASTYDYPAAGGGFVIWEGSATSITLGITDNGAGDFASLASPALSDIAHLIWFVDRSGSGVCYTNGTAGTPVDVTAAASTLDNAHALTVLADPGGSDIMDAGGKLYYLAAWHSAAWLDTHLQAAIAAERCARVFGTYSQLARGAAQYPSVTRATTRYFQVGSTIHPVGSGGQAIEEDANGKQFLGVFGASTSVETWTSPDGHWTVASLTDALSTGDSPLTGTKWTEYTEVDATAAHYMYGTPQAAVADDNYLSAAAFLKKGSRRYVEVTVFDTTAGFAHACFIRIDTNDMSVLEAGQYGASSPTYVYHSVDVIDTDVALVRLIVRNEDGGAKGLVLSFAGAETNDSYASIESYAGVDSSVAFSVVGHSLTDAAVPYFGPPIVTAGASVTKNAEVITRPVGAYSLPGTWEFVIRTWDTVPTNKRIFAWYDASTSAVCELYLTADGYVYQAVDNGSGATVGQSVAVAVNDGELHRVRASFATNNCGLWVDGTLARDTSCAMPDTADLDVYAVGFGEGGNYLDGNIVEARFTPGAWT